MLSEEAVLDADREGGDGSTPTLQKSEGQARSVAVFPHLLLTNRPEGSERLLHRGERREGRQAAPQTGSNQGRKLGDGAGRKCVGTGLLLLNRLLK